jgi:hypothetical protein
MTQQHTFSMSTSSVYRLSVTPTELVYMNIVTLKPCSTTMNSTGIRNSMECVCNWYSAFHEKEYWNILCHIVFHKMPEIVEILEYILYSNNIPPTTSVNYCTKCTERIRSNSCLFPHVKYQLLTY